MSRCSEHIVTIGVLPSCEHIVYFCKFQWYCVNSCDIIVRMYLYYIDAIWSRACGHSYGSNKELSLYISVRRFAPNAALTVPHSPKLYIMYFWEGNCIWKSQRQRMTNNSSLGMRDVRNFQPKNTHA